MTAHEFIGEFENWDNHRPLLWLALESTSGNVVELGVGKGSTEQLHKYCEARQRRLYSYENNARWFENFKKYRSHIHEVSLIQKWDVVDQSHGQVDVVFIDHAPGERRHVDVERFKDKAKIIVCHDTEPSSDHGYQFSKVFPLFKYRVDFKSNAAWATAVSNHIDVSKWVKYEISGNL